MGKKGDKMPKWLIALISSALAGIMGFLLGGIFTVPQNKEMEELLNSKNEMTQQIISLQSENGKLIQNTTKLEGQVRDLKNKLLTAYEIEKEASKF